MNRINYRIWEMTIALNKLPRSNCPRQNVAHNSLNKCSGLYALNQDARHYALDSTTNKTNCVKHTDVRTNVKAERTGQGKNGPEITVWNIGLVVRVGRNGQLIKERGGENDHIGQTKKEESQPSPMQIMLQKR